MITKTKKNKNSDRSSLIFSVVLGILILGVVGFLVGSNLKINEKRAELNSQLEGLRIEYQALLEKKKQLQAQVSQSAEDQYLEQEARERFNLRKPGEEVVTILPPEEKEESGKEKEKKWWNLFSW
jgi:cell division protein FtsB